MWYCEWSLNLAKLIRGHCMRNFFCFSVDRWYCGKVNQWLSAEAGDANEILGSYQFHTWSLLIHRILILSDCHISFCYFFHSKWWGFMIFGHIWKSVLSDLTYFHWYWTIELWVVKWGLIWYWCEWYLNWAQLIRGHSMSKFVVFLSWQVILWKSEFIADCGDWWH